MQSPERPTKQEAFLTYLRGGWTSLHLDARRAGVSIPAHLKKEAHLVLQYGYDLPIPIPDLEVDEHGVRATLSFAKAPLRTFIPWEAVYVIACIDGRGILYHEDVPEDVSIVAARPNGDGTPGEGTSIDEAVELAEGVASGTDDAEGASAGNGRVSERFLRSVPESGAGSGSEGGSEGGVLGDGAETALPTNGPRRRRRPQLRLVK